MEGVVGLASHEFSVSYVYATLVVRSHSMGLEMAAVNKSCRLTCYKI